MSLLPAVVLAVVAPAGGGGIQDFLAGPTGTFVFMGGMLAVAYFMMIRPQQQQRKRHMQMIEAVKRGDTVVLNSGMIGKVVRVEDKELGVEIAQNVTIKVIKTMITEVRVKGEPAIANDAKA
jgi:preprotein translocase subunit YajC